MSDLAIGLYASVVLFVLASVISIFSPDIRSWIVSLRFRVPFSSKTKRNDRIKKRIELLEELSGSVPSTLSYFANQVFLSIIFLAIVLFFGFMMILRVHPEISALVFMAFWGWFMAVVGTPFDVAIQLRHPKRSIDRLNKVLQDQ